MRRSLLVAVSAVAFCLAGCDAQPSNSADNAGSSQKRVASAAEIAQELSSGNYQKAADAAKASVEADSDNAELHLLLARAQARLQNVGEAVKALKASFDAGFHDPRGAIDNPDFDRIRDEDVFVDFARKYGAGSPGTSAGSPSGSRGSAISAGDVSITESANDRSRIRAGDIVIED